jgi:hypothetical protein
VTAVALGVRRVIGARRAATAERALATRRRAGLFSEGMVRDLPPAARRYFLHAIAVGTPLAGVAELETVFTMKLWADARRPTRLIGRETLAPPHGFVWTARAGRGPLRLRVRDHYAGGEGMVSVTRMGVPLVRAEGPDVTRSARHRLAIESIWLPSSLLPAEHIAWESIDHLRARVAVTIDGERIPLTLTVDEVGRLREVTMLRHGTEGVAAWQPIPYGVRVEAETQFDGYTLPTRMRGGWWYGSERQTPDDASVLRLTAARFT